MKLNTGFLDFHPTDLADLADTVGGNTTGVAIWAPLKTELTKLDTDKVALRNAMMGYGPGRATAVNTTFQTLAETFGRLATDFMDVPDVTDTDLASTRMPMAKERVRATEPPPAPGDLRLRHGVLPGEVVGTCDPPPDGNIRGYEGGWTLDPNSEASWSGIETFSNSRAIKFSGLVRGKDIWVRVRARNTVGAGAWSDPATIMVT